MKLPFLELIRAGTIYYIEGKKKKKKVPNWKTRLKRAKEPLGNTLKVQSLFLKENNELSYLFTCMQPTENLNQTVGEPGK